MAGILGERDDCGAVDADHVGLTGGAGGGANPDFLHEGAGRGGGHEETLGSTDDVRRRPGQPRRDVGGLGDVVGSADVLLVVVKVYGGGSPVVLAVGGRVD